MRFYLQPTLTQFRKSQLPALRTFLSETAANTVRQELRSPADLQLSKDTLLTLSGACSLSYSMFCQVSQKLCPGLSKVVLSLSLDSPADELQLAVSLWNKLLRSRFDRVAKYRALVNRRDRVLEGLIGSKQPELSNSDVLNRAVAAAENSRGGTFAFLAGAVCGRALSLWFRQPTPFAELAGDKSLRFYEAVYVSVQENTGAAIRATPAVISEAGVSLLPIRGNGIRIARVAAGGGFDRKISGKLGDLFSDAMDVSHASRIITAAACRGSLGFPAHSTAKAYQAHFNKLVRTLRASGVSRDLAGDIVKLVVNGGEISDTVMEPAAPRLASTRSVLDLFVEILRAAKTVKPDTREMLEFFSWRVLCDQSSLFA